LRIFNSTAVFLCHSYADKVKTTDATTVSKLPDGNLQRFYLWTYYLFAAGLFTEQISSEAKVDKWHQIRTIRLKFELKRLFIQNWWTFIYQLLLHDPGAGASVSSNRAQFHK
jgi:hypothetical protein